MPKAILALRSLRAAQRMSERLPGHNLRAEHEQRSSRRARRARCHPLCRDRGHRLGSLPIACCTRRVDAGALRWGCICGSHDCRRIWRMSAY